MSVEVAGNVLRFTSDQASDFLELSLFFVTKGMCVFGVSIELHVSGTKVFGCESRIQMKVLVKFIYYDPTRGKRSFPHYKPNAAVLDGGLRGLVVREQCLVQIA